MIGTKLAHYEITSHLGTGGMGEVYQATDSKLGRSVAIKLLPVAFAHDQDRASRFEREARALASLNHPNIAAIYGVEETEGRKFLVMELVPGETLAEKIRRGPILVDEALTIAREIAEGLEAAHEKGIIHRDLKPANVKVTPEGKVKILDFGLAKAYEPDPSHANLSNSPTISIAATNAGIILGTAGYMSPEQASGKWADKRADIWSFGVVLWEMLTGHALFSGETVSHTLADVLRGPIDFNVLPALTPGSIRNLLRRCLTRDAKARLRDIGEARLVLSDRVDPEDPTVAPPAARSPFAWIAVAAVLAVALGALAVIHFREPALNQAAAIQTEIAMPEDFRLYVSVLSPDGTWLAVSGPPQADRQPLYVRPLGARSLTVVPGSEGATPPFWSPNSEWIAFGKDGKLWKWNPVNGQPPKIICNADIPRGGQGTWSEQDIILFAAEAGKPIQRVPASGGVPRNALELDSAFGEEAHLTPSFLPGGQAFLYASNGKVRGSQFFATLDGKVRRHLQDSLNGPPSFVTTPSGTGLLVYVSNQQLLGRPMNAGTGELTGDAVLLIDGIVNGPSFSFAEGRYLTYNPVAIRRSRLRWMGNDGTLGEILGEPSELPSNPNLSFDGKRILLTKRDAGKFELLLMDLARGTTERLLTSSTALSAIWTPDGRVLYSRSDAKGGQLIERSADAQGVETILARIPSNAGIRVRNIDQDGKRIAVSASGGGTSEAWLVSRPEGKVRPVESQGLGGLSFELSPNGRWLVQFSGRSIQLRSVPADVNAPLPPGSRDIGSLGGNPGNMHWSADGSQLLGITAGAMTSIPIDWTDGTPSPGKQKKLFDAPNIIAFEVTPDGRRFLVTERLGEAANPSVILIQNWPALLGK